MFLKVVIDHSSTGYGTIVVNVGCHIAFLHVQLKWNKTAVHTMILYIENLDHTHVKPKREY